jgi:hypothetical protein
MGIVLRVDPGEQQHLRESLGTWGWVGESTHTVALVGQPQAVAGMARGSKCSQEP